MLQLSTLIVVVTWRLSYCFQGNKRIVRNVAKCVSLRMTDVSYAIYTVTLRVGTVITGVEHPCSTPVFAGRFTLPVNTARSHGPWRRVVCAEPKGSDTSESFLSKVAFETDFRKKSCTCVTKTFAIFFFRNKLSWLEHVLFLQVSFASFFGPFHTEKLLESFFRKSTFEIKLSGVNGPLSKVYHFHKIEHVLFCESHFRRGLSKATFERKLSGVSLP